MSPTSTSRPARRSTGSSGRASTPASRAADRRPNTNANANASAFRKNSAAVELASPPQDDPNTTADNIANQITFNWTDYLVTNQALIPPVNQEAKSYKIEVSLAADFSTIFDTATVDQTTYTPFGKTYPEGPLYWRVQAIDGSGNTLTKSPARLVNKTSPKIATTFPTNGSTQSGVPFFQWTPQAFAATYVVEVYKNGDTLFSPANRVLNATTKFSAWAPTTSLPSRRLRVARPAAMTPTTAPDRGPTPGRSRSSPRRRR